MTNKAVSQKRTGLKQFRGNLLGYLCVIVYVILLGWSLSPFMKIGFNITDSVNGYVFLIIKDVLPEKDELVAFWPPENDIYPRNIWFVKYIKGVAGDEVTRRGQSFFIDGEYVGDAKKASKGGVVLRPGQDGVIPQGFYFVWTPHADSFDSRYEQIGWIPEHLVIGVAYRIL